MSKAFFKLKNNDVEYSTDFNFFLEHQIFHVKSGTSHEFNSLLEAKNFRTINSFMKDGSLDNEVIRNECRKIHEEILNGLHGEGKLVD